jgi:hypothetical protein
MCICDIIGAGALASSVEAQFNDAAARCHESRTRSPTSAWGGRWRRVLLGRALVHPRSTMHEPEWLCARRPARSAWAPLSARPPAPGAIPRVSASLPKVLRIPEIRAARPPIPSRTVRPGSHYGTAHRGDAPDRVPRDRSVTASGWLRKARERCRADDFANPNGSSPRALPR